MHHRHALWVLPLEGMTFANLTDNANIACYSYLYLSNDSLHASSLYTENITQAR